MGANMDNRFIQPMLTNPFAQLNQPEKKGSVPIKTGSKSFAQELQTAVNPNQHLNISKHAKERMVKRGIEIASDRWSQISNKVQQAKAMGVTESLVLLPDAALVISAKNQTVITAMNRHEANTQIFTNINGTIIIDQ